MLGFYIDLDVIKKRYCGVNFKESEILEALILVCGQKRKLWLKIKDFFSFRIVHYSKE